MPGKRPAAVVNLGARIEECEGRKWLRVTTDHVLNPYGRVLNLMPQSPEKEKRILSFDLALGLLDAGLDIAQVNCGPNDHSLTVVMENESVSDEEYRKVAQRARAVLIQSGCDVIIDREMPHNLLGQ